MSILDRDLNECQSFEEISQWRAAKYEIDKKSGDDYTGILTNIYKEPTHFIYELLQNADDTKATNVKFILSRDKIEFFHDGTKEFSLSDIISITGVGNSSKDASDTTSIGKFGVGFKAVFAVTEKPLIYSTTYNFQIENLSVPSEIRSRDLDEFTTIFQLNFKQDGRETLYRRNESLLRSITPETILFLKNICKVDIIIDGESLDSISVSRTTTEQSFGRIKYSTEDKEIELLKFSDKGCSIVYQIEDGVIVPVVGSKISVFFPTIVDSNLSFMVDAPFQTSTTRESIDFELPNNQKMVERFNALFVQSLNKLKSLNLFTVQVFNDTMPVEEVGESEDFPIYKALHATFLEYIKTNAFVPTSRDSLVSASKTMIANNADLAKLLRRIQDLNFAHPDLSNEALSLLAAAGGIRFDTFGLLGIINRKVLDLSEQTDEWLYSFYEYCLASMTANRYLYNIKKSIMTSPIIKTRAGNFTAAYFNDNPNVFRPSKGIPDHRTIHPLFLSESSAISDETRGHMKSFLSELDITERKPVVVLKEDYFRDYFQKSPEEKVEIFQIAADIYRQSEPKDKPDIVKYLHAIAFVPSRTGEFKPGAELYDSYSSDLMFLLGNDHPELFTSDIVGNNAANREFALELGVIDTIKVDPIVTRRTNHRDEFVELYEQVGSSQDYGVSTKEFVRTNYDSKAISLIFESQLSGDMTARLAPLLQKIQPDHLKESFEWTYYGNKKEVIGPSNLCKLLQDTAWIAKDDQMLRPIDMSFDEFCELYKLPRNNILQDLEWSNDNIIKQLSEKDQELLKLAKELDLTPDEIHEFRQNTLAKRKKAASLNKRNDTPITEQHDYIEPEPDETSNEDLVAVPSDDTSEEPQDDTLHASKEYEAADTEREFTPTTRTASSSGWSNVEQEERAVLKGLIEWYEGDGYSTAQESDDKASYTMNKNGKNLKLLLLPKNNSGYNIEISEDGQIVKTIAVIKSDLDKKRFVISESQWNLAKREDVQHSIYLVSRQGDRMTQVVIDNLRERIRDGSAKAIPGVIYYE
ncbi:MAG TPA: hypothetical protein PKD19_03390 [Candidatus Saccharibacteria bacterium]|nr:hypothetical protein [Candidatus Saccharibacteria bacterium]